jgi:hypothetical protein
MPRNALLAVLLLALSLGGCGGGSSPTEGTVASLQFSLSTTLTNTAGIATIQDAQVRLDNAVKMDSCPRGATEPQYDANGKVIGFDCVFKGAATVTLSAADRIGSGSHTLLFFISQQTTNHSPSPYRISAFTIQITDIQGKPVKTISLPAQSGNLASGQALSYTFTI